MFGTDNNDCRVPAVLAAAAGAAVGALGASLFLKPAKTRKQPTGSGSTTGSTGGVALYETKKAVNEYLQFHFGSEKDILPYEFGPQSALGFTSRCAILCERYCEALKDFNGESDPPSALDVGCAVGGASFELAKSFEMVVGLDYSQHFVDAAEKMKTLKCMNYTAQVEGDIYEEYRACIPEDVDVSRVRFLQGDACNIPKTIGSFDVVLAANLLCRLPEPALFLRRLPSLVRPGGIVVLVSPYSWLEAWTPKQKWIGATVRGSRKEPSCQVLMRELENSFDLVHQEDMPFLIREHVRKYQWGCSHATVWKRRKP
uniref:Methyltransferase type 11 domain-containing protein n=1 Tax=Tetraselmis sp. GSL018 TaxID=582737 RepID=A0A061QMJ7_9CHLO